MKTKRKSRIHTRIRISTITISLALTLPPALTLWTAQTETYAHYTPDYAKTDLLPILQKPAPSPAD